MSEYLKRYNEVMKKLNKYNLLTLPEEIKEVLKNTTELETKVEMLEMIERNIRERKGV